MSTPSFDEFEAMYGSWISQQGPAACEAVVALLNEVQFRRMRMAAVRALLDHEDTAGHRLVPNDPRMESDGLGILETWQVRYVLDGTMP